MNDKEVDYPPFLLPPLFRNAWDCTCCKTTKRGGVKISQRTWGTGTFSTGFYGGIASSLFLQITLQMLIKSTGSSASFKAHGKYTANLITINQQWCSFPISRQWHFHWSRRCCPRWHFCSSCPHSHHIVLFFDELVVDRRCIPFDNSLLLQRQV
jgi:hypothetical protein